MLTSSLPQKAVMTVGEESGVCRKETVCLCGYYLPLSLGVPIRETMR